MNRPLNFGVGFGLADGAIAIMEKLRQPHKAPQQQAKAKKRSTKSQASKPSGKRKQSI